MSAFSQRLIQLRAARSLSPAHAAKATGVVERAYPRYEYSQREPQLSALVRLADFYGVTLDYLAGRSDDPGTSPKGR